jgi:hypothetical protein
MFTAAKSRIHPKRVDSHKPPYSLAKTVPSRTPTIMKGSHLIKSCLSMLFLLRCDKHEDSEVGIMVKREVVVAVIMASPGSILKK